MNTFASARKNVDGWRFCALVDSDKELVKPANGTNKTAAANVKEMEKIIDSLPTGTYYLGVRNSPAAKYTYFPFEVGTRSSQQLGDSAAPSKAEDYNLKLYAENVELAVRNKELETLNKILEEKCAEYITTIDELEQELQDHSEQLSEGGQGSVMETIIMTALPQILEKINANGPKEGTDAMPNDSADAEQVG